MLRANLSSVLPPKFRGKPLHSADTGTRFPTLIRTGDCLVIPIPLPCNAGKTLEPTCASAGMPPTDLCRFLHPAVCRSVHCSKATSTIPSRRLSPAISSLCIRKLCTPPCHCISLNNYHYYIHIFYYCQSIYCRFIKFPLLFPLWQPPAPTGFF